MAMRVLRVLVTIAGVLAGGLFGAGVAAADTPVGNPAGLAAGG
jgi:hypothetical protein